ncbi:hypothetical protein BYT27DRAFT_7083576 [Phlegmacium glaucopus]|nr:hypothetical protein BYT27DRAFT_7083576 [Phlegmacium glaucopus]
MDVDTSTFTPRLRLSRHSPVQYRASTSEAGPSRLPNVSQILDLDLKDIPLSDDQPTSGESNIPKITTTPTATRPGNPAAVLRALMSRLPAHSPSPTQSHALSVQDGTERESDFDTISESNAAPSIAQESLKDIVSKALRDPGNTPQKVRRRRNSIDASEVEASPRVGKERAKNKGKRRSMSDDEVENASQSIHHRNIRSKSTSQPITMEFLRERFSDSHNLGISIEPQRSPATSSNHDSSNDTATLLRDLNSSQATPPAATSTPQQSLRLSTTSRFQFHSNLLDQDSEMQKAIEGLDSFDEGVTHGQDSASRALNSSKILQTSPVLRHHCKSSFNQ